MTSPEPPPSGDGRWITDALALPFEESEVKWKPQTVKNNRAMALAYVDARVIMDRLDDVLGVDCWQDTYDILADGSVQCKLRIRVGNRWITKTDVGSPSEQPDGGDRLKAAFSDALKRAAVKFGMGRYLYRLPHQWADYDPVKRQFVNPPRLPAWAMPPKNPAPRPAPAPEKKAATDISGPEFHRRLREADAQLALTGKCPLGSLLAHVTQAGVKAGFGSSLDEWAKPAIEMAAALTRDFKTRLVAKALEDNPADDIEPDESDYPPVPDEGSPVGGPAPAAQTPVTESPPLPVNVAPGQPLPAVTQRALLDAFHDLDLSWHDEKARKAVELHIGRKLGPKDHVSVLSVDEAQKLITALNVKIREKKQKAAEREAKKAEKAGAA